MAFHLVCSSLTCLQIYGHPLYEPFKDEAQTALFKDPVRAAQ